jgi:hypothetical protein
MRFATARQAILLIAFTCLALYALDYYKNPQLWRSRSQPATSSESHPELIIWMNHLCCSGCLDDVRQALAGLPGMNVTHVTGPKELLSQSEANVSKTTLPDYGNQVELPITDLKVLDLVALDRALRDKGFVAGRMELRGVEHFRLEAVLDHLCCGMCDRAIQERVAFLKAKGMGGQFKWLDSVTLDHERKSIVAYARFLEPGKSVDVAEFMSGLNYLGYEPHSLRIVAEHIHKNSNATAE